jgi:competence CoiA-like predicted nuclease
MKYALVCGKRTTATISGDIGLCPGCRKEVIAHCGEFRINHWKHKGKRKCDPWWESETEWHRSWKNKYPEDWQEIPLTDEKTGEKHIADVQTSHGLVIEFQHSHLDPQERTNRERFYKNMVWVVDGTRLKRDYTRFLKGRTHLRRTKKQDYFIVDFPDKCFSSNWLESSVPVIFDFLGMESLEDLNYLRNNLYCLFPRQNKREAILAIITRESFIDNTINGEWFRKQQESQEQNPKPPKQNKTIKRRKGPTHYYDPKKGRFVIKPRL